MKQTLSTNTYNDALGYTWKEGDSFSGYMWLSFCDPYPAKQFLGVIITESDHVVEAVLKVHGDGINPGGEVASYPLSRNQTKKVKIESYTDRMLTREEAIDLIEVFNEE